MVILQPQRVEIRPQQVAAILNEVLAGERITLSGAPGQGRSSMIRTVAASLGPRALVVQVPPQPDKLEVTILSLAEQLGSEPGRRAAELLRNHQGDPVQALDFIAAELARQGRKLFVDDADALLPRLFVQDTDTLSTSGEQDRELAHAFALSQRRLGTWLRRHAVLRATRGTSRGVLLEKPKHGLVPYSLGGEWDVYTQALWEAVKENPRWFRTALSRTLLSGKPLSVRLLPSKDRLFAETWSLLPANLQQLVRILAVHGRPLPIVLLDSLLEGQGRTLRGEALRTLLAESAGQYIWLYEPWLPWVLRHTPGPERSDIHQSLAQAFAASMKVEGQPDTRALSVAEAHRHFLAVPDLANARVHARYGIGLLLEYGRALSLERRRKDAVKVYEAALDVIPALHGEGLGAQARAYAVHYLHYNRAKESLEPILKTEEGYREAVKDWSTNALFWSRLALARFVMNEPERAFSILDEAQAKVPPHRFKARVLIVRTVNRLLWRGLIQEALLAWGDYKPAGIEKLNEQGLLAVLERGWETNCLRTRSLRVYFHQPVRVVARREAERFVSEVSACQFSAQGTSPVAAVENLVMGLRTQALALHRQLTHTLSPDERRRKELLLGHVDLIQSGLVPPLRPATRVFGRCERMGRDLLFRVLDSSRASFSLPEAVLDKAQEGVFFYARIATGSAGEPGGPVLELEPAEEGDPQALWAEWEQLSTQEH